MPNQKTEQEIREEKRQTPEGKLLVRYGFEPYDTESCARRVAEKATLEIALLVNALKGEHAAIDTLLAERIAKETDFYPTRHRVWPVIVAGSEVLKRFT